MENNQTSKRSSVTVIGMGPMGQALAGAFLQNGHPVTVWNRTAGKADAVVARGATLAQTVRDAIEASPLVVICVLDYHAVEAILGHEGEALSGKTLVNLTADSPDRARSMAKWAADRGIDYLDGAIMTPTPTIGTPAAVVLYSGSEAVYSVHQPTLASIGGTASYLGDDHGRAAAFDVSLLDLFWTTMSGYVHALALARAENISPREFARYAQGIVAILPDIMEYMAEHVEEDSFPGDKSNLNSAAAGMEHIIHAAKHNGIDASVLSAAYAIARQAIDAGYGMDAFSRLTDQL
ncbi:NAD(P)-dependent oxidoreductase [Brevibacillus choshinensis]|uniref:NAD(P)-dependent oxidoreductase n=1 Tax=Brevibacillus choshinensis TaxID=54911 RepID=A0ABX7FLB7_BRECH|nr:NAD(P)-binding domain-containing protein [Brevibacillus choshinensis]QRG66425.1 NAD(P)-dependent oxidoreductase [Brevibacillus choshinensis]